MATVLESIEIEAPRDRIAAFFVPQRMVYWYGAEMNADFEVLDARPEFREGQKVRISGQAGLREVAMTVVVTRFEQGHTLEWQFRDQFGVRGLQRWDLMELADGTMRVSMLDDYRFPGGRFGEFWDRHITRRAISSRNRRWLAALKKYAERE